MMAAVSALMLTACADVESDLIQSQSDQQESAIEESAVTFDSYLTNSTNVTRAGKVGPMNNDALRAADGAFGVYGYYPMEGSGQYDEIINSGSFAPYFMVNQKVAYDQVNNVWTYSPLKYWPSTQKDSQSPAATANYGGERYVSFFAYAPYVEQASNTKGIVAVTDAKGQFMIYGKDAEGNVTETPSTPREAVVNYEADFNDLDNNVDLLWGVAPLGGLSYQAADGSYVVVDEGMPLIDLKKPAVNTNIKFQFQHALSRFRIQAVASLDQVSEGGVLDENTKIVINNVYVGGRFGSRGYMYLNNQRPNQANWFNINGTNLKDCTNDTPQSGFNLYSPAEGVDNVAKHLKVQWNGDVEYPGPSTKASWMPQTIVGVTTTPQDVMAPSKTRFTSITAAANKLAYSESTPYYTDAAGSSLASATLASGTYYTFDDQGAYTEVTASATYKYPAVITHFTGAFTEVTASNVEDYATYTAYAYNSTEKTYTPKTTVPAAGDYVITTAMKKATPYYVAGTYYRPEANYVYFIPSSNIPNLATGLTAEAKKNLRKLNVLVDYYVVTRDRNLAQGVEIVHHYVNKEIELPEIPTNGKTYTLNLILGLTSVGMSASVADWKNASEQDIYLPQNLGE